MAWFEVSYQDVSIRSARSAKGVRHTVMRFKGQGGRDAWVNGVNVDIADRLDDLEEALGIV